MAMTDAQQRQNAMRTARTALDASLDAAEQQYNQARRTGQDAIAAACRNGETNPGMMEMMDLDAAGSSSSFNPETGSVGAFTSGASGITSDTSATVSVDGNGNTGNADDAHASHSVSASTASQGGDSFPVVPMSNVRRIVPSMPTIPQMTLPAGISVPPTVFGHPMPVLSGSPFGTAQGSQLSNRINDILNR